MASGTGDEWQIRLDAAAEVYVASLRSTGLVVSLPAANDRGCRIRCGRNYPAADAGWMPRRYC
jgi:hypothetical protein